MERDELAVAGVVRQAELIRAGEVSSRELVELYLDRIERLDPELNAFVTVCGEQALAAKPADGPFKGVPFPVKDLQETAGIRTTTQLVASSIRVDRR